MEGLAARGARAATILSVALVLMSVGGSRPSSGAAAGATVTLSTQKGAAGDTVLVTIERWPGSLVTISLCGNDSRRGSRDCDLLGARTSRIEQAGPTVAPLVLGVPPVGCPCVVRVEDQLGDLPAYTIPIALAGVAQSPALADEPVPDRGLELAARVRNVDEWPESWLPAIAGSASKVLVVEIRNPGATATHDLRLNAAVGRDRGSGEPIGAQTIDSVAPGATRRVVMPFSIAGPVWGEYLVYGTVSGANARNKFAEPINNDPWALELIPPVLLLVAARMVRRRERRRRSELVPPLPDTHGTEFQDSSPDVGVRVEERCSAPAYDPRVDERTAPLVETASPRA